MEINEKKFKEILKEERQEFQKYVGALAEEFQSQTQAVAEQYSSINKKLDSHSEMIAGLAEDMEVVKMDTEFIKEELKKKVGRDEFIVLGRRLSILESKVNR